MPYLLPNLFPRGQTCHKMWMCLWCSYGKKAPFWHGVRPLQHAVQGHHPRPRSSSLPKLAPSPAHGCSCRAAASATRIVSCTFHDLHLVRGGGDFLTDQCVCLDRLHKGVSHSFQSTKPDVPNYKCRMQYGASDNAGAPLKQHVLHAVILIHLLTICPTAFPKWRLDRSSVNLTAIVIHRGLEGRKVRSRKGVLSFET